MVCQIIELNEENESLQNLDLSNNSFSKELTQNLMTKIADSSVCNTLITFSLSRSANFSSIESIQKLAFIISEASDLT